MCGMPSSGSSRQDLERYLAKHGVLGEEGVRVFETRDGGLEWIEDKILLAAGIVTDSNKPPLELSELSFFEEFDEAALEAIGRELEASVLEAGKGLFLRDEPGDRLYFVRRGRIRILLPLEGGKRHHLATVASGEMFGEVAFLDGERRSADAEAAVNTWLYVLPRAGLASLENTHPEVAARIFEGIAKVTSFRLRMADAELRTLEER